MKTIIAIITVLILFSCGNNTTKQATTSKSDTSRTLLAYRLLDSSFHIELGWRITREGLRISPDDSLKNIYGKDSIYLVPNPDSAKVGKLRWSYCPKELILIDGGKNIDSLFKKHTLHFPAPVQIVK